MAKLNQPIDVIFFNSKPTTKEKLMTTTTDKIKVRSCQIINTAHPEWGTFGVMDEYEDSYDIIGDDGTKNISKTEANKFWKVLEPTPKS